jgi:ABC-type nickel/cobalt efflux system permease component RcnA
MALAPCLLALVPTGASAHPLGNFTINHYTGIRVSPDAVLLDFVLDRAEIPTFQEIRRIDPNGDGTIDPIEAATLRVPECIARAPFLDLRVGGSRLAVDLTAAGLTFPPGAGGLPTMRLVCTFRAALPQPLTAATTLAFDDQSFPERIGWREITVAGDGTTIGATGGVASIPPTSTASARLSAYPTDLLATPLDMRSASVVVTPGGPALVPFAVPDATPLVAPPGSEGLPAAAADAVPVTGSDSVARSGSESVPPPMTAAVPGGVGTEIAGLLEARDLTPLALLLSLLTAALLGAGHALTPGHGKTVMAAYLVGARGTARHAVGLGLSVTVSHTLGILVLAGIVLAAGSALPPEAFNRWAPLASALLVVGIGGWLVAGQLRAHRARRAAAAASAYDHPHDHDHPHESAHGHGHAAAIGQEHAGADAGPSEHTHGGVRHRHVPAEGAPITWRSLALLGLAGGIVPSTNALLLLLAAIAGGRPAWGLVLVISFGVGMAVVLGGVGLVLVHARGLAVQSGSGRVGVRLGRLVALAPAIGAGTVLALGLWLTSQALVGSIAL